ncbi:MAG: MopE-related protein, partial [Myxococcota bacterium]|nr:MopE-related protein [Myxococcota bacterium]
MFRISQWTALMIAMLFSLSQAHRATAQAADEVLVFYDNVVPADLTTLEATLLAVGATAFTETDTWPADLTPYRLVVIALPNQDLSPAQVADVDDFVDAGGLLVLAADINLFVAPIQRLNDLLAHLGVDSSFAGAQLDSGCGHTATVTPGNPLVLGVSAPSYAWSSEVIVAGDGEVLVTGESAQALVAYEDHVLLVADTNMFTDECSLAVDNEIFMANLFDAWCDMDLDGEPRLICGGGDCDDEDAAIHPGAAEDCVDGIDNDCDGDVDELDDECGQGDDDDDATGDDDTTGDDD